jgi:hypothetical protein
MNYAQQNQGGLPTNVFIAEPLLADEARNKNIATDQFEIVYQGSINDLTNPSNTILMREREPHQTPNGTWKKVYGFADGSSRTVETPDGNFQAWEQEHMISPTSGSQPSQ